jgi:hypothetical protein
LKAESDRSKDEMLSNKSERKTFLERQQALEGSS